MNNPTKWFNYLNGGVRGWGTGVGYPGINVIKRELEAVCGQQKRTEWEVGFPRESLWYVGGMGSKLRSIVLHFVAEKAQKGRGQQEAEYEKGEDPHTPSSLTEWESKFEK